jgi:hypothetical protein
MEFFDTSQGKAQGKMYTIADAKDDEIPDLLSFITKEKESGEGNLNAG